MKNIYSLVVLSLSFLFASGQAGEWTWVNGSNTYGNPGNHGTQGVPSALNEPAGLYEACEWTDLNGNFWMYGGLDDQIEVHNDLWKYDPVANIWTWMSGTNALDDSGSFGIQGVASPSNRPPSIAWGASSWVDKNGNLWMFGGCFDNSSSSTQSNLWEYDITANEWTWVNGPGINVFTGIYGTQGVPDAANYPPGRSECAAAWVDNKGDLWLFGGYYGDFNDLWRYNIAGNVWTWMKGSDTTRAPGAWGLRGIEDPSNTPSGRWAYTRWKDNCGNLWFFGGDGYDAQGNFGTLGDLWRYNVATNNWTWMNGLSIASPADAGFYGTRCVTSAFNEPAPRAEGRAVWTDTKGNFWMFGGFYEGSTGSVSLNDLWMYCVSSNQWTWESGDSTMNVSTGNWGTMGVTSPANIPNARYGAVSWTDHKGHLYFFGGSYGVAYNDIWKFNIDTTCGNSCAAIPGCLSPVASFQSTNTTICAFDCINFSDLSTNNPTSWQWSFQGATPSSSNSPNPQGICYFSSGNYNVTLVATNGSGTDSVTFSNYITVNPTPPTPVITQKHDTLYCSTDTSYTSYQWYADTSRLAGATDTFLVVSKSGDYNVDVSNEFGCSIAVGINIILGIQNYTNDNIISLFPNPATDELFISCSRESQKGELTIYNVLGETIYTDELNSNQVVVNCKAFPAGVYFVQVANENGRWVGRFVKE